MRSGGQKWRRTLRACVILTFYLVLAGSGERTLAQGVVESSVESEPPADRGDDHGEVEQQAELGPTVGMDEVHGGLLFRTHTAGRFLLAPAMETEVRLRASGFVVRGTVRQAFLNTSDLWMEGVYVFPLPENAAVDGLHMIIGERIIEGQIHERKEAKRIYQEAKIQGKKASLVEQERPNIFTTSVSNIGPGETVEVEIEYQQTVRYDSGRFHLRFPTVVGPRYIPGDPVDPASEPLHVSSFEGTGWAPVTDQVPDAPRISPPMLAAGSSRRNLFSLSVDLRPGFELASLTSSSHRIRVQEPREGLTRVELAMGEVLQDRDFTLIWEPRRDHLPKAALLSHQLDGDTFSLLMVLPPAASASAPPLPREMILVMDTSGSMHGASIEQAREALLAALDRLATTDTFNIVQFNSTASSLFPTPVAVHPGSLAEARQYIRRLEANGGTEMVSALTLALAGEAQESRLRQVVFVTDGAVGNEEALFSFIETKLGLARLFPVGIGSAPNSHFMRRAARFGRGSFTYIGSPSEVETAMGDLFAKLESPQLAGIVIDWPDPAAEVWPQRIPDLYEGEPLMVAARIPGAGGEVTVRGHRGNEPWHAVLTLVGGAEAEGVDKLWARRKIEALMDEGTRGRSPEAVREEVLDVALRHHLVSKYTSLVAVDVTPTRPLADPLLSAAVPTHLPHGWSRQHVLGSLPQGGTSGRLLLIVGFLSMIAAWALRRRSGESLG